MYTGLGGCGKTFYHPTSNSAYGSGVVSSMRKAEQRQQSGFDPAAINHYFPQGQVVSTSGGGAWQQPMGRVQGHVHAPNCPNFATGANTKYPSTAGTGQGNFQIPGMPSGSNYVNTTDHIEILQGDAATAYLAQHNGGGGGGEAQHDTSYAAPDQGSHPGMTVSFQPVAVEDGGGGGEGGAQAQSNAAGEGTNVQHRNRSATHVKVNGLPMGRNPRWRQMDTPMPHVVSSLRNPQGSTSQPAFKLCGKCPKCKDLHDPGSLRPSALNFREQGVSATGSRRFPLPRGVKVPKSQATGQGGQGQQMSLPLQGDTFNACVPGTGN